MSLTTPAACRSDLNTLLSGLSGAAVYDHEPYGVPSGPSVTVFFDGYDALFWNWTIRIYVPYDPGAREGQVLLDSLMPAIEDRLDSQWGPVNWTVENDEELRVLKASWSVQAGREDI